MLSKKKKSMINVGDGVVGKYIKKEAPAEIPSESNAFKCLLHQTSDIPVTFLFTFRSCQCVDIGVKVRQTGHWNFVPSAVAAKREPCA
jgi:hypothetical protein